MSTPTRPLDLAESDANSDTEGKCLTHLKTIKRPKINNLELLEGVDQVSQVILGCIKLAEAALGSSTSQQNPEVLNPPQKRSGEILSDIDRVDSKLADCIKIAESTLQNKEQKLGGGIYGGSGETNPQLVRMGPSISKIPQGPSPKSAHIRTPEPAESSFDQDFDQFMNGLDNFEPFDDLEDWSDNVKLFMGAIANPPKHANALWELAKLKKGKAKALEQSSESIFDKP